jgi:hypothetical protein
MTSMTAFRRCARSALALIVIAGIGFVIQRSAPVSAKDPNPADAKAAKAKKAKKNSSTVSKKSRTTRNGAQGGGDAAGSGVADGSGSRAAGGGGALSPANGRAFMHGLQPRRNANSAKQFDAGAGAGERTIAPSAPPHPDIVAKVMAIQNRITPGLLEQAGIVGTCTGLDQDGNVVVRVYLSGTDNPIVPDQIDGVAINSVVTGPAYPTCQSPTFNPGARLARPFPIGVSGTSSSTGCSPQPPAGGTIGCRLKDSQGNVYALGCNHDFAAENKGLIGDFCYQPGSDDALFDLIPGCAGSDVFGTLFAFKTIDFRFFNNPGVMNRIDAAVIKTDRTMLENSTPDPPIGYGKPRTLTVKNPTLGLGVQKYGKATGLTTGVITGINQIITGVYFSGLARFSGQMEITQTNFQVFNLFGDSGALVVTMDRLPVGLLFSTIIIFGNANPIQEVLDFFGMQIDGDDSPFDDSAINGKEGRANPNSP